MIHVRRRTHRILPTIPTASMADIAFLVNIFFLVTTVFSPDRTVVELPTSVNRDEVFKNSIVITLAPNEAIKLIDGDWVETVETIPQFDQFIADVLKKTPDRPFVIKGDRTVPYKNIEFVLERLRLSRAKVVYFLTNPRGPRQRSPS